MDRQHLRGSKQLLRLPEALPEEMPGSHKRRRAVHAPMYMLPTILSAAHARYDLMGFLFEDEENSWFLLVHVASDITTQGPTPAAAVAAWYDLRTSIPHQNNSICKEANMLEIRSAVPRHYAWLLKGMGDNGSWQEAKPWGVAPPLDAYLVALSPAVEC